MLTIKEVMKETGISRSTLYRLVDEGLPYTIVGTRKKLFDKETVKEFINSRNRNHKTPEIGHEYTDNEIAGMFRCKLSGKVRKSNTRPAVIIIPDYIGTPEYNGDYWQDDELFFSSSIRDINVVIEPQKQLYVFEPSVSGYTFLGIVESIGGPYSQPCEKYKTVSLRLFKRRMLTEGAYKDRVVIADHEAMGISSSELLRHANKINRPANDVWVTEKKQLPHPYVARYVHARANGICECCGNQAPFFEKDGTPHLELYYIPDNNGMLVDSINSVAALCPNCRNELEILKNKVDIGRLLNNIKAANQKFREKKVTTR